MKTSRSLLLGTFVALLAVPVVLVAYTRIAGDVVYRERPAPERTPPAAVAALRDFNEIELHGDFTVEITRSPDFSVAYAPLSENRGEFQARVVNATLVIEGYGNRAQDTAATLRIGLPELNRLEAEFAFGLTIANFDSEEMEVTLNWIRDVSIENNRIGALELEIQGIEDLQLTGNTIGNSQVRNFGTTITTE